MLKAECVEQDRVLRHFEGGREKQEGREEEASGMAISTAKKIKWSSGGAPVSSLGKPLWEVVRGRGWD